MDAASRARILALAGIEVRATQADAGGGGGKTAHEPAGSPKGGQFTSRPGGGSRAGNHPRPKKAAAPQNVPRAPASPRLVKQGDSGEDVRYAQYAMSLLGFQVAQDGRFGPETAAAVKQMQQRLGVKHPNGHLTPALLHKMQDAVRLSPCVGGQRDLAFEAQWEQRDDGFEDGDLDFDETAEAILDALDEVERGAGDDWDERGGHDVSKELRIPSGKGGGRWTKSPITAAIAHALEEWAKGDGPDDPFVFDGKPIDREPLRKAAVARGITLKRGASREDIVAALKGDLKVKVRDAKSAKSPDAGKPVRFTLTGGKPDPAKVREVEVENKIRAAYRDLKGRTDLPGTGWHQMMRGDYVLIADLRDATPDVSHADFDATLRRLAGADQAGVAIPEAKQSILDPRDRKGGLQMGGQEKHWLQLDDPSPRPVPKPDSKLRNLDVGVFTEPSGKLSLWEVSDSGERRRRVALVDDLAGLEKWANDNGESHLADWARKERGGAAPKREAPFGYKFPRDQALLDAQIDEQIKGINDDLAIEGASAKATTVRIHARMKRMRLFPEGTGDGLHYVWKRPGGDVRLDDSSPTADPEILAARRLADAAVAAEKSVTAPDVPAKATPAANGTSYRVISGTEANRWGRENFTPIKDLPADQQTAIRHYAGGAYDSVNKYLRTGGVGPSNRQSVLDDIKGVDAIMAAHTVPEDVVVSRAGHKDMFGGEEPSAWVGRTLTDPAYLSTTLGNKATGVQNRRGVLMTIEVPAGTHGYWVRGATEHTEERELLLDRGQRLEILSAVFVPQSGKWKVHARVKASDAKAPDVPAKATPAAKKAAPAAPTSVAGIAIDPEAPDFERLTALANARTVADLRSVATANNVRIPSYIKSKEDMRRHLALEMQYPAGMDFAEYEAQFTGASAAPAAKSVDLAHLRTLDRETARDELDLRKVDELKALLREQKLPVSGRKRELVDRLVEHTHGGDSATPPKAPAESAADILASLPSDLTPAQKRARLRGRGIPKEQIDALVPLAPRKKAGAVARSEDFGAEELIGSEDDDTYDDELSPMELETAEDPTLDEIHAMAAEDKPNTAARARELALLGVTRALGHDVTPGHDELHHYWTLGPGRREWVDSPTPWRTLLALLVAHVKPPKPLDVLKKWASRWFIEVKGYAAGSDANRVAHGHPPRGHRVGPG